MAGKLADLHLGFGVERDRNAALNEAAVDVGNEEVDDLFDFFEGEWLEELRRALGNRVFAEQNNGEHLAIRQEGSESQH